MIKGKVLSIAAFLSVAVAIGLMITPYGAMLRFAYDGGATVKTYSYFSLVPYGYANFSPFIAALLSCASAALSAICIAKNGVKLKNARGGLLSVAAVVSAIPFVSGYGTVMGAFIMLMLFAAAVLSFFDLRQVKNEDKDL